MLKLAALGALGYAGYKYYRKNLNESGSRDATPRDKVAGGPLSEKARVQPTAGPPPTGKSGNG